MTSDRLREAKKVRFDRQLAQLTTDPITVGAANGQVRELGGNAYDASIRTNASVPNNQPVAVVNGQTYGTIRTAGGELLGPIEQIQRTLRYFGRLVRAQTVAIAQIVIESAEDKGYPLFLTDIRYQVISIAVEILNDAGAVSGNFASFSSNYPVGEVIPAGTLFVVTLSNTSSERIRIQANLRMQL